MNIFLAGLFVFANWCGVVWYLAYYLIKVRAELAKTTDELHAERVRRFKTEYHANELVDVVTPLIEKTDWMTGRWGGQFATLVRMEDARNTIVDSARKAIWEIPIVADHIRTITGEDK
jgi:hypothetical protein